MNCPSRADHVDTDGWNQNPPALNADATTQADLNHMANARLQRDHRIDPVDPSWANVDPGQEHIVEEENTAPLDTGNVMSSAKGSERFVASTATVSASSSPRNGGNNGRKVLRDWGNSLQGMARRIVEVLIKYGKFVGPGFMVAVAYIDPGECLFFNLICRFQTFVRAQGYVFIRHSHILVVYTLTI